MGSVEDSQWNEQGSDKTKMRHTARVEDAENVFTHRESQYYAGGNELNKKGIKDERSDETENSAGEISQGIICSGAAPHGARVNQVSVEFRGWTGVMKDQNYRIGNGFCLLSHTLLTETVVV